jgi:hypothetical protein
LSIYTFSALIFCPIEARMNHYREQWIADWCVEHGWTDWFLDQRRYWAFPPHSVMPTPIPLVVLQAIKTEKGHSPDERRWIGAAAGCVIVGGWLSYGLGSPLPILVAFGVCAIVSAWLEEEYT